MLAMHVLVKALSVSNKFRFLWKMCVKQVGFHSSMASGLQANNTQSVQGKSCVTVMLMDSSPMFSNFNSFKNMLYL